MSDDALQPLLDRIPERWGKHIRCDAGWHAIIIDVDAQLSALIPDYEIHQVKEKFGVLRFYWSWPQGTPEETWKRATDIVAAAEALSARTCEGCGTLEDVCIRKPNGFWIRTLCAACAAKEVR